MLFLNCRYIRAHTQINQMPFFHYATKLRTSMSMNIDLVYKIHIVTSYKSSYRDEETENNVNRLIPLQKVMLKFRFNNLLY